jgi:hypothetical protein
MVGGFATNINGYQRFTADLDIWIDDTSDNRARLRKAFTEFGIGDFEMIATMQFVPGWTDFQLGNGLQVDILTEMKGLEKYSFDECLKVAVLADIEGLIIPFLHINQLIANKKAVNRPKDQIDVANLEKIKKIIEENSAQ